jgi:hypothetical protein
MKRMNLFLAIVYLYEVAQISNNSALCSGKLAVVVGLTRTARIKKCNFLCKRNLMILVYAVVDGCAVSLHTVQ